jgi:ABC-2 type transport system permease protein
MKLYKNYLNLHLKSILQYKISFALSFISQIFVFFTYYFFVLALFDKFSNIKGFTVYEVLLTFSIIQFGYSINEVFGRGIDHFDRLIIKGGYDRLLLRPRPILFQVLTSEIDYAKLSRVIQAVIILIIALLNLNIDWNIYKIISIILMIISAIVLFFGIFLLTASYCFITVQGLEVRNVFTDGGKHMAQYPIGIFRKGFVWFFTFIIPFAFVNYYPLLYVLGRNTNIFYAFSPLLVFIFLIPCFLSFKLGSKRYCSVGS